MKKVKFLFVYLLVDVDYLKIPAKASCINIDPSVSLYKVSSVLIGNAAEDNSLESVI